MAAARRGFLTTAATAVGIAATLNVADPGDHRADHSRRAVRSEGMQIGTRLTERFGIKHPIMCAPMAFVTGDRRFVPLREAVQLAAVDIREKSWEKRQS